MFPHYLQHFELLLKCVKSARFTEIEYLFIFKNISERKNF